MSDAMFETPSQKIEKLTITKEYAQNKLDRAKIKRLKAS